MQNIKQAQRWAPNYNSKEKNVSFAAYPFHSGLIELIQNPLPLRLCQLSIKPEKLNTSSLHRNLQKIQKCSPLTENNAFFTRTWLKNMFQTIQELCNLWRFLPIFHKINLETAFRWARYEVSFLDHSTTYWTWTSSWSSPAWEETLPAHLMSAWCKYRIICKLQAYGTLPVFTLTDTLNNLFNICSAGDNLLWSGRILVSFKKYSSKLVQVCILLWVTPTAFLLWIAPTALLQNREY